MAMKRFIGRAFDRRLPGSAEHVIAVTDDIRAQFLANAAVHPDRVSVIPNGVELGVFGAVAPTPPRRNGSRTLLFTGNLAPYQGIDLMLQAFRALRVRRHDVRLVIATEDRFEPYERRAVELGVRDHIDVRQVSFAEVPQLLSEAEVALNPRVDCDGLPQKLLNYLAAGKAVVSFQGSAKHLVDGENAVVVANNDTDAFACAIERLLADDALRARLGEAGRELVRTTLSWSGAAERIEAVYEGLR
jgi:glycosyltransferase involved in cell wall biosynthesis